MDEREENTEPSLQPSQIKVSQGTVPVPDSSRQFAGGKNKYLGADEKV